MIGVAERCDRHSWVWVAQRFRQILGSTYGSILRRQAWHLRFGWKQFNGIRDARSLGFIDEGLVTPVMFHGGSDIPAFFSVASPGAMFFGFDMDDGASTRRSHGRGVEIEGAKYLGIGRQFGIDAAAA